MLPLDTTQFEEIRKLTVQVSHFDILTSKKVDLEEMNLVLKNEQSERLPRNLCPPRVAGTTINVSKTVVTMKTTHTHTHTA